MRYKDYYQLLGVSKQATQDEIKRAYKKLARKYHPDVSKEANAETKFKEMAEAYEVLKDPEKRAAYDQLGHNWRSGQDFNPPPDWDAGFEFSGGGFTPGDASTFSDFFESLFGRAVQQDFSHRHTPSYNRDHHAKILIDLEDAFSGASRTITLHTPQMNEHGRVSTAERNLKVKIPKGIYPGQQIRLAGMAGHQGGDLYLQVEFNPHPLYRVQGRDIYLDLPLAPWEAALGAKLEIPTPGGKIDLKIPENSASGRKLRLKGRGLPAKAPGDFYVILQLALPPANSDKARDFYRKMAQELPFNPRTRFGG